jgi:tRNA pseudouridine38-40 synthase
MAGRVLQLVLQYDGTDFSGWQVQPETRTVQGTVESVLARLCGGPVRVTGAGRTDAGVHARGQAAGVEVPAHWTPDRLRTVMNAQLPGDVSVAAVHVMQPEFHARFSATSRRYSYVVGLDAAARSPFRRRWEWPVERSVDSAALAWCANALLGEHRFFGFAVRGTAPAEDDHRCEIRLARWREVSGGLVFDIEANRFLHHMVRFLVGTMLEVATHQRPRDDLAALLVADCNDEVSPPAPACGLCLEHVTYPADLYLTS